MMMPRIFGENLFDDFMDFPFGKDFEKNFFGSKNPLYGKHAKNMMKTDVRETDTNYEVYIDLPGFKKEQVQAELNNGYLTISASKGLDKEKKDDNGQYIRRERYSGNMSRSFYVGDNVTEQDIQAKFEDGILRLIIPKQENKQIEDKKYISIEG